MLLVYQYIDKTFKLNQLEDNLESTYDKRKQAL